jgi:hypothetical protein
MSLRLVLLDSRRCSSDSGKYIHMCKAEKPDAYATSIKMESNLDQLGM